MENNLVTRAEGSLAVVALQNRLSSVTHGSNVQVGSGSVSESVVEVENSGGDASTAVRTLVQTGSVRTYVQPRKSRLCGQVDRCGVYLVNSGSSADDDVETVIRHNAVSRLERIGAALDSLNPFGPWSDPPRTFADVKDVGHLQFPDGSVVVSAVTSDGRVTTWSRGPDGWFQKRLRGLSQALFRQKAS